MATSSISETNRVRYLLGLSSPAEREHIESEYFEDEDAFQEMLTTEDDLIDAYARGELTDEERRRFETRFASSLCGGDRVHFARAFANAVTVTPSVETNSGTFLNIFKTFQSPVPIRTATIATVILLLAVLAWLVIDRRRMTNELRELRAESAELSKRTEALQQTSNTERTSTADVDMQPADRRAQPHKPMHSGRKITAIQRALRLPDLKNDTETIANSKSKPSEKPIGNRFVNRQITQLPIEARNVVGLLSLQPAVTRDGHVTESRANQANLTLDGVDMDETLPLKIGTSGQNTIRIPTSLSWIRLQIALETAAIHEDYRVIIKTADDRPVTSVDWSGPLTPNQTIIDTPYISTDNLSSGEYVLSLMGKEPDGSFVKAAQYSFKVIKF